MSYPLEPFIKPTPKRAGVLRWAVTRVTLAAGVASQVCRSNPLRQHLAFCVQAAGGVGARDMPTFLPNEMPTGLGDGFTIFIEDQAATDPGFNNYNSIQFDVGRDGSLAAQQWFGLNAQNITITVVEGILEGV